MRKVGMWVLIKIKVPGEGTTAEQPRTNRGPKGDNRGRVLCYPMPCCTENAIHISKYTDGCASHKPAQRSILTEQHTGATCKWARGMAWASDYIGGFLNRLTIADQSRIFRSNMETMSAKSPTPQLPALAIWWSGPAHSTAS